MRNRIVVRYQDSRVLKGYTSNFLPNKEILHVVLDGPPPEKTLEVHIRELKAIFFVKDFAGNPAYNEKKSFDPSRPVPGRKIRVVFKDGEVLVGTTQGYQPDRMGFFVVPVDPGSNNERCFVVSSAVKEAGFL
ncbi:MAG: hypothetical protein M1550_04055 [Deltaproteobacteria bacterium]|nr:hypothetical protein [Deltaproteobacteria bacterium]